LELFEGAYENERVERWVAVHFKCRDFM
jgi:hypothetical protein